MNNTLDRRLQGLDSKSPSHKPGFIPPSTFKEKVKPLDEVILDKVKVRDDKLTMGLLRQNHRKELSEQEQFQQKLLRQKERQQDFRLEQLKEYREEQRKMTIYDKDAEMQLTIKEDEKFNKTLFTKEEQDLLKNTKEFKTTQSVPKQKMTKEQILASKQAKIEIEKERQKKLEEDQMDEMNKRYRRAMEEQIKQEEESMEVHNKVMKLIKQNRQYKKNKSIGSPEQISPGSPGKLKSILQGMGKSQNPGANNQDEDPEQQARIDKIFSVREEKAKNKTDKLKKDIQANQLKILKIQKDQEQMRKESHQRLLDYQEERKERLITEQKKYRTLQNGARQKSSLPGQTPTQKEKLKLPAPGDDQQNNDTNRYNQQNGSDPAQKPPAEGGDPPKEGEDPGNKNPVEEEREEVE